MAEVVEYNLHDVLGSSDCDFLIRNSGEQVKIESLKGKKVGLYFSAAWCGPCHRFTPKLAEAYNELLPKDDFEVVFVSGDEDDESFNEYFAKMPWLAMPFSDSEARERLDGMFSIEGIPHLVVLDGSGKLLTNSGVEIIREYGAEAYPFSAERIKEIKEAEEVARREQSLKSVLISRSRDYVLDADGKKVSVSELEGKTVALYFALSTFSACSVFTPKLIALYENLKEKGENFEIVMIPLDDNEEAFKAASKDFPGFSLPVGDKSIEKLVRYFELFTVPTVVILGPDGKTIILNAAEAIEEHGSLAYPFTPEKFAELKEIEKAKEEAQTLESILVSGDLDFVIGKEGQKVPVSDLVGKHVLLYFSAHWCPPCRAFTPKLVEAYNEIKGKVEAFEIVFISSDKDQSAFDEYYATMPWLAFPFGDDRKLPLSRKFKVKGIPTLVALGPTGKTITTEARDIITQHGAKAYPFTKEQLQVLEAETNEMAKGWPEKLKHALHKAHELVLSKRTSYTCDGCNESGQVWSYLCKECDFDLHPKCALGENKEESKAETDAEDDDTGDAEDDDAGDAEDDNAGDAEDDNAGDADEEKKDGIKCNGDVCYRT